MLIQQIAEKDSVPIHLLRHLSIKHYQVTKDLLQTQSKWKVSPDQCESVFTDTINFILKLNTTAS